jgi:5'-methylthioadenosine phosphorylase
MYDHRAEIGIIGGTGIYDPEQLDDAEEIKIYTPYGAPSDLITVGTYKGTSLAFIKRHGRGHQIPPHKLPNQANIWALRSLGV